MLAIFHWLLDRLFGARKPLEPSAGEAAAIDQSAYFDLLERKQKALLADIKQLQADRHRISIVVRTWARDCIYFSEQRPAPTAAIPSDVKSWLFGLNAREVRALASANDSLIRAHMYERASIPGVRAVQRLTPQHGLRFPKQQVPQVPARRRMA